MAPRPAQCGTDSGYHRHRRTGETACDDCKAAHSSAEVDRKRRQRGRERTRAAREAQALKRRHGVDYMQSWRASKELGEDRVYQVVRVSEYLIARVYDCATPDVLAQLDAELGTRRVDRLVETYPEVNEYAAAAAARIVRHINTTTPRKEDEEGAAA